MLEAESLARSSGMREAEEPQGSLLDSGIRSDAAHRDPRLWILL